MLNEEASNISQGQKQLLTIARAIICRAEDPHLRRGHLLSVDTRTEMHIQKAMDHLMEGRTSFIIAHRLSTIRDADLILVHEGRRHCGDRAPTKSCLTRAASMRSCTKASSRM